MTEIVSITGHRPEKIRDFEWVRATLSEVLLTLHPDSLVQGMAAGVDLLSAEVAASLSIPYTCARPWAGHQPRSSDRRLYERVLAESAEVVDVNDSQAYIGPHLYQRRNEYMVDHSTILVAVWDGSKGGTGNCVSYARRKNVPIVRIDPTRETVKYPFEVPGEIEEPGLTLF